MTTSIRTPRSTGGEECRAPRTAGWETSLALPFSIARRLAGVPMALISRRPTRRLLGAPVPADPATPTRRDAALTGNHTETAGARPAPMPTRFRDAALRKLSGEHLLLMAIAANRGTKAAIDSELDRRARSLPVRIPQQTAESPQRPAPAWPQSALGPRPSPLDSGQIADPAHS